MPERLKMQCVVRYKNKCVTIAYSSGLSIKPFVLNPAVTQ